MAQYFDDTEDARAAGIMSPEDRHLVSWVTERKQDAVDYRDTNFKDKWDEYYRLWRGIWHEEDKTRGSERSRLISPALQQAVERKPKIALPKRATRKEATND